jgi:8-oxo-dGTP diphosphatase
MNERPASIKVLDPASADASRDVADAVVLTRDSKILLQQRPANWGASAGRLTAFGGHIDPGETAIEALVRELNEELGAIVDPAEAICLGALTEAETGHSEIVHTYFWHDRNGTITGCYECEAVYYDRIAGALAHPKIMDYLSWMLLECQARGLMV